MMNDASPDRPATAAAIGTLFPGDFGKAMDDKDRSRFLIAIDWQQLASVSQIAEMRGAIAWLPLGYMSEVMGRAAAAGEQLSLALTAVRDAEVWVDLTMQPSESNRRVLAGRALAEASGLWAVSTGHAAMNVVARIVCAHPRSTHLKKGLGWELPPEPFSTVRGSNLSINRETVKAVSRATRETGDAHLQRLVEPLSVLLAEPAWQAVVARRDIGYHRWRPQSIGGGVATTNPWVVTEDESVMSMGDSTGHVQPELEAVVAETRAGYNALSTAMGDVFEALPEAMSAAGVGIWLPATGSAEPTG